MIDIKVLENEIPYICSIDERDVYMQIKGNEDTMKCLIDEKKIVKAIYEMWLEDELLLYCLGYSIPVDSPDYGENIHHIEGISLNDIYWIEKETPSKILKRERIRLLCNSAIAEALEIEYCMSGVDASMNFIITTKYGTLHFSSKTFEFYFGGFDNDEYTYISRKEKKEVIKKIQMAILENRNLVTEFLNTYI